MGGLRFTISRSAFPFAYLSGHGSLLSVTVVSTATQKLCIHEKGRGGRARGHT